ncbi:MAG TPA: S41 family peptidase [Candidatus Polarisedimenticolia bacterium]|jgi:carboxyl-terminal processing protease|nr:S41 family peptidase [Candidatus Polarisedimenticolia bacterium]
MATHVPGGVSQGARTGLPGRPAVDLRRARAIGLAGVALLSITAFRPAWSEELSKFERERARMMLRIVRDDLEKFYYSTEYHGLRLDEAFQTAGDKIAQATSISQLFAAVARPLLQLDDSHTSFIPPGRAAQVQFGWRMQAIGDRCYVTAVQEGTDGAVKGLKRGDLLVSLDGHPATRKSAWGLSYVYRVLSPRVSIPLVVQSPDGPERKIDFEAKIEEKNRVMRLTKSGDLGDYIRELQDEAYLARHRFMEFGDDLVIWKMPAFDLDAAEIEVSMKKVRARKATILDLRGNGGGAVETLERLVGAFAGDDVPIGDVKSRERMKPVAARKAGDVYKGTLVVLVDGGSASASELFARVMQLTGRAKVLGDRTAGAVMMSRTYSHMIGDNSGIFFGASITIADIIMADGKSLEKTGVTPDEVLLPTGADLAAGRDPVMSRAASLCGVTIDPVKAGTFFPIEWKR